MAGARRLVLAAGVVGIATIAWLAAQAPATRQAPAARAEPAGAFVVGEQLVYDIGWSGLVTAGTATVTVEALEGDRDGSSVYRLVAEGEPIALLQRLYTLHYRAVTLVDARTGLPRRAEIVSREGNRRRTKVTTFDQARGRARYEVHTATVVSRDVTTGSRVHDALSALHAIRRLPLRAGATETLRVSDSGEVYHVQVRVAGRETIATPIGARDAWRLVPEIVDADERREAARAIVVYVSADARRLPLRMAAELPVGTFSATLRDVRP